MSNDSKRRKELREAITAKEAEIRSAREGQRDLSAKKAQLEEEKRNEYANAINYQAMTELAEAGGDIVEKVLVSKSLNRNTNLEVAIAKLAGGLDAVGKRIAHLIGEKKKMEGELSILEGKEKVSKSEATFREFAALLKDTEVAWKKYLTLSAALPVNAGEIAVRQNIGDQFYRAALSRHFIPATNLIEFITWAASLLGNENPFYGPERSAKKPSHFRKGHVFNGVQFTN